MLSPAMLPLLMGRCVCGGNVVGSCDAEADGWTEPLAFEARCAPPSSAVAAAATRSGMPAPLPAAASLGCGSPGVSC